MTMAKRTELEPVFQHTWPTIDWPMARLMVRLEKIAANKSLTLQTWNEDGLGRAPGCTCRLPSGVVILLRELEYVISHFKAKGPDVFVDAADLQKIGVESILSETLLMLGLMLPMLSSSTGRPQSSKSPTSDGLSTRFGESMTPSHDYGAGAVT